MKSFLTMFTEQLGLAKIRNWDCIYIAVDWHGTISPPTYSDDMSKIQFYPNSLEALKLLSDCPIVKLILYSSTNMSHLIYLVDKLSSHGIKITYINSNPEVQNSKTGDFGKKFYFNILLDDKAGFDPLTDWIEIGLVLRFLDGRDKLNG